MNYMKKSQAKPMVPMSHETTKLLIFTSYASLVNANDMTNLTIVGPKA